MANESRRAKSKRSAPRPEFTISRSSRAWGDRSGRPRAAAAASRWSSKSAGASAPGRAFDPGDGRRQPRASRALGEQPGLVAEGVPEREEVDVVEEAEQAEHDVEREPVQAGLGLGHADPGPGVGSGPERLQVAGAPVGDAQAVGRPRVLGVGPGVEGEPHLPQAAEPLERRRGDHGLFGLGQGVGAAGPHVERPLRGGDGGDGGVADRLDVEVGHARAAVSVGPAGDSNVRRRASAAVRADSRSSVSGPSVAGKRAR